MKRKSYIVLLIVVLLVLIVLGSYTTIYFMEVKYAKNCSLDYCDSRSIGGSRIMEFSSNFFKRKYEVKVSLENGDLYEFLFIGREMQVLISPNVE